MKLRTKDWVILLLSIAAVILGCWTTVNNGMALTAISKEVKLDMQQQIAGWYMMLQTVLFVVLGVVSCLRVLVKERTAGLQRFLYGVGAAIAAVYTLLVIVDASSLIALFIPQELWNNMTHVIELVTYVLYLAIGINTLALCVAKVREQTNHQHQLGMLLLVWVALSVLPLFVFAVRAYQFDAMMWVQTVAGLAVQVVFRVGAAYGAFCNDQTKTTEAAGE